MNNRHSDWSWKIYGKEGEFIQSGLFFRRTADSAKRKMLDRLTSLNWSCWVEEDNLGWRVFNISLLCYDPTIEFARIEMKECLTLLGE